MRCPTNSGARGLAPPLRSRNMSDAELAAACNFPASPAASASRARTEKPTNSDRHAAGIIY
jgi:hypothetical protein